MTETCRPAKCIEAIRVTLLDECTLLPVCGPLNGYAMGCIIDPDWSPEVEEGDESTVKDDCGNICLYDQRCDLTKRWNLEFKIARPDKEFIALIGGDNLVVDGEGVSVGVQHLTAHCSPYLFVELFERTDDCPNGLPVYFRHIFPAARLTWTGNEKEGVFRILQIEGKTRAVLLANVGEGPYFDIPATAIDAPAGAASDYFWFEDTTIPEVQCGSIPVPCEPPVECEVPNITSASTPGCEQFCIQGTCLDLIDQLDINNDDVQFWDPNGPNAGNNFGNTIINSWTATEICVQSPFLVAPNIADSTVHTVQTHGVGGEDYGTTDIDDVLIADCDQPPVIQNVESTDCGCITLAGTAFDDVDHVTFATNNNGNLDVYDPSGPNAGNNDPNVIVNQWDATTISICWCALGLSDVYEIQLRDEGNTVLLTEPVNIVIDGPTVTNAYSPECNRLRIEGTCLDMLDQIIPTNDLQQGLGYNWYVGNDQITINEWSATAIDVTDTNFQTSGFNDICGFYGINNDPCNHSYGWIAFPDCVTVDPCPFPEITNAQEVECERIVLTGHDFDLLNHIQETDCFGINFYDPAGPDNGSNPVGAIINQWDANTIDITYPGFCSADCLNSWQGWGVGNTPFYNSDDLDHAPNINPTCCEPQLADARSNFCSEYQIILENNDFAIDHVVINGIDYYDPNGPNAGLNPPGVTFPSWGTNIQIHDETNLCGPVDGFTLYELGDPEPFVFTGQGDIVYCGPCPVNVDLESTDCDTFCFTAASGLLGVNQINMQAPSSNYYNPAGPDAGLNSGTTIILTWTDQLICIKDTAFPNAGSTSIQGNIDFYDVGGGRHFVDGGGGISVGVLVQGSDNCPPPTVDAASAPDCFTFQLDGTNFDSVDRLELNYPGGPGPYYDPAGPNAALNPVSAVINLWSPTQINITDEAAFVGTVNNVHLWATGDTPDYGTFPFADVELFSCPLISLGTTENCDEFVLYSDGGFEAFTQANHLRIQTTPGGFVDYYDPAGPDNGLNPGTATILSWTATEIRIVDTALGDTNEALVNAQFWGVGETPEYPIQDLSSFVITDCDDVPSINNAYSNECDSFVIEGARFDQVNHIVVNTDSGSFDYYDPAGPDAGLNPATAQIVGWTASAITIYDTQFTDYTVQSIQLLDVGDVPDYGTFDVGDFLVADCPAPALISGNDSGVDRFQLHGTGFDAVKHIRVIPTSGNPGPYDYFDPNMPGGYPTNPGFVTILSWTDTLIEVQHTGINTTIDKVHLWGCCGPLGEPDFGEFNIANFSVT